MEGAARHLQRTTEAPASVTVITASDIETFGWRTLADVLKSVRGFHMTYDRNYSYVGVRAFGRPTDYNNRVLVMVDGHRLNDSVYDGALLGTEFPVDLAPGRSRRSDSRPRLGPLRHERVSRRRERNHQEGRAGTARAQMGVTGASFGTYERARGARLVQCRRTRRAAVGRRATTAGAARRCSSRSTPATPSGGMVVRPGRRRDHQACSARPASAAFSIQGALLGARSEIPTASWDTTFGDPRYHTSDNRGWASAGIHARHRPHDDSRPRLRGPLPLLAASSRSRSLNFDGATRGRRRRASCRCGGVFGRHAITIGVDRGSTCGRTSGTATWRGAAGGRSPHLRRVGVLRAGRDRVHAPAHGDRRRPLRLVESTGGAGRPRLGLVYRTEQRHGDQVAVRRGVPGADLYELYYFRSVRRRGGNVESTRRSSGRWKWWSSVTSAAAAGERPPPTTPASSDLIDPTTRTMPASHSTSTASSLRSQRRGDRRARAAGRPGCSCAAASRSSAPARRRLRRAVERAGAAGHAAVRRAVLAAAARRRQRHHVRVVRTDRRRANACRPTG